MSNHCQKVLDLKSVNHEGALLYLRLRDAQCQKDSSMRFAARVRCKSDTSVTSDGPAASRFKLKVKPECLEHRERVRGWVQGNLSYDLGKRHNKMLFNLDCFKDSNLEIVVPEENEFSNLRRLEVHLEKIKDKKEKRYVKNVENLQEFFSSELKSELKASTGQKLMDEIHKIKAEILDKQGKSDSFHKVDRKSSPVESKKQLQRLKERFLRDKTLGSDTSFYKEALDTMKVIEGFEMFGSQYGLNKRKRFIEAQREATNDY